jgi:hypothetical protein
VPDHHDAVGARGRGDPLRVDHRQRERLLDEDVLAGGERSAGDAGVRRGRRRDDDDLDRAIADGTDHGFVKVLTVPGKDKILGVTIVGEHAGDLLAEFVLAMKHGLGLNKILGTIHTYPTLSEANKYVAGEWRRAHTNPFVMKWLARYHAWRRG